MKRQLMAIAGVIGGVTLLAAPAVEAGGFAYIGDRAVVVDVSVINGPADVSDITIEVFDRNDGSMVAMGSDPSELDCGTPFVELATAQESCYATELAGSDNTPGLYQLGAVLPPGYVLSSVECSTFDPPRDDLDDLDFNPNERFTGTLGEFSIDSEVPVRCEVAVEYITRPVTADVVVINDDGGTADGSTFVVEVYDDGGMLVDSAPDPAPNDPATSAVFDLPFGDYTFGVSGTDGYEISVEVTVEEIEEIIDDPSAEFTVAQAQTAAGVITADDVPAPTTTTEPPATTAAPTTVAETTPPPAPPTTLAAELPATGATSQTLPLVVLAIALLGVGAVAVGVTRRS